MLKAGTIYLDKVTTSDKGTPQGGVISPCLANFTLDGLQKIVESNVTNKAKSSLITIRRSDGVKTSINVYPVYCRYVDDIIIICRSESICNRILPLIKDFLYARGLELSSTKTCIDKLKRTPFNFLGYTFKYYFNTHNSEEKIHVFPSKVSVTNIKFKIRKIFRKSQSLDSYNLISKLNPVIKG